jgi:hypothetical protein
MAASGSEHSAHPFTVPRMGRLGTVAWALLAVTLSTGCTTDEHREPRILPEGTREEMRELVRKTAADVVREEFGALPAPLSETERRCDSWRWYDNEDAFMLDGLWELPLAPEDHERVMRALSVERPGLFNTRLWQDGQGGFWASGQDVSERVGWSVRRGETPATLRLQASSHCMLDPG